MSIESHGDPTRVQQRMLGCWHKSRKGLRTPLLDGMVVRRGSNFRGRRSDEMVAGDCRCFLERRFALCRSERCPVHSESIFRWKDDGWIRTIRLLSPFAEGPDGVPVRVVVVQACLPHDSTVTVTPEIRRIWADTMPSDNVVTLSGAGKRTGTATG